MKHTMVHRCRQSDWFGVNLWTAVIEKAPVPRTLFYERALLSLGYVIRQTSLLLVVMSVLRTGWRNGLSGM